jgi:hypothetical protein
MDFSSAGKFPVFRQGGYDVQIIIETNQTVIKLLRGQDVGIFAGGVQSQGRSFGKGFHPENTAETGSADFPLEERTSRFRQKESGEA